MSLFTEGPPFDRLMSMAKPKSAPLKLLARAKCLLGQHDRSRSQAVRYADNTVLSICRNCGKAMFRHPREGWMVERRAQQRCFDRAGRPPRADEGDAPPASNDAIAPDGADHLPEAG